MEVPLTLYRLKPIAMPATRRRFLASCAGSAFALATSASAAPDRGEVALEAIPDGGLQPRAVVDSNGVIHLVYLYGNPAAADVAYIKKAPGDRDFSSPLRVNDRPGSAIALGTVRGANVAVGKSGRVHVAWNGSGNPATMFYARLNSAKRAFEPQRSVVQFAGGLDGGGAITAGPQGNVYVMWHAADPGAGPSQKGEQFRRVWMAKSTDDGRTFARETPISPPASGVCGCCAMGALADSRGNLYALYRTARETVHRDMVLLTSTDRGEAFQATTVDPWEIGACPMSTVSLTESLARVFVSWETQGQVYFAPVAATGVGKRSPAPGQGLNRKHPSIAVNRKGEILLAWTEGTGWKKGGSLAYETFDSSGRPLDGKTLASAVPAWGFGAAIAIKDEFLIVC